MARGQAKRPGYRFRPCLLSARNAVGIGLTLWDFVGCGHSGHCCCCGGQSAANAGLDPDPASRSRAWAAEVLVYSRIPGCWVYGGTMVESGSHGLSSEIYNPEALMQALRHQSRCHHWPPRHDTDAMHTSPLRARSNDDLVPGSRPCYDTSTPFEGRAWMPPSTCILQWFRLAISGRNAALWPAGT